MFMQRIAIKSRDSFYSVEFCSKIRNIELSPNDLIKKIFIIDKNVFKIHSKDLTPIIKDSDYILIESNEENKSLKGIETILEFLINKEVDKSSYLVAIGGGIIQDLVSFTSHIYFRGISWIYIPTTLLAMSDSCIGAKASINFQSYKNQIGAFHAPKQILICTEFLTSLAENEIKSGYGEIIKLHLIKSYEAFQEIKNSIKSEGLSTEKVERWIHQSLIIKKKFVEEDEYDQGIRKILNYGHSFGHALETSNASYISHGLAITWGINLVNFIAFKKSILSEKKFHEIYKFTKEYILNSTNIKLNYKELMLAANRDKKVINKQINLVYLTESAELCITPTNLDDKLFNLVEEFINKY
jgi:3-dehydroquinate synthase